MILLSCIIFTVTVDFYKMEIVGFNMLINSLVCNERTQVLPFVTCFNRHFRVFFEQFFCSCVGDLSGH